MTTTQGIGESNTRKVTWKSETRAKPQPQSIEAFSTERGIVQSRLNPFIAMRLSAWRVLQRHAKSANVEVGGVLIGEVFADPGSGQLLLDVQAAIPAEGSIGSGVYFKLTEEAWDHISSEREQLFPTTAFPNQLIVGWYHTHPGLGVFYSGTDKASQKSFFAQPWNFGLVVDPVQDRFGIFLGAESKQLPIEHLGSYPDPEPRALERTSGTLTARDPVALQKRWAIAVMAGTATIVIGVRAIRRSRRTSSMGDFGHGPIGSQPRRH